VTPEQMAEEQRLVDELRALADEVLAGSRRGDPPEMWRERRAEIARLRRRVRQMKREHLGGAPPRDATG
jgi:hypothetical protein